MYDVMTIVFCITIRGISSIISTLWSNGKRRRYVAKLWCDEQLMNIIINYEMAKKVPWFLPIFQFWNVRYTKTTEPMQSIYVLD